MATFELTVIVNGTEVKVHANPNAPLHSVLGQALQLSGNTGQPPENWVFKDANGNTLDSGSKIQDLGINAQSVIYLSLKAGVGGV
jgi:hypothetical protein